MEETYENLRKRLTRIGDIGYWIMIPLEAVGGAIGMWFINHKWLSLLGFGIGGLGLVILYAMFFYETTVKSYLRELKEAHEEEIRKINFKVKMGTYEAN